LNHSFSVWREPPGKLAEAYRSLISTKTDLGLQLVFFTKWEAGFFQKLKKKKRELFDQGQNSWVGFIYCKEMYRGLVQKIRIKRPGLIQK